MPDVKTCIYDKAVSWKKVNVDADYTFVHGAQLI